MPPIDVYRLAEAEDRSGPISPRSAPRIRGAATMGKASAELIEALPALGDHRQLRGRLRRCRTWHTRKTRAQGSPSPTRPDVLNDEVANHGSVDPAQRQPSLRRVGALSPVEGRWEREGDPPLDPRRCATARSASSASAGSARRSPASSRSSAAAIAYHGRKRAARPAPSLLRRPGRSWHATATSSSRSVPAGRQRAVW